MNPKELFAAKDLRKSVTFCPLIVATAEGVKPLLTPNGTKSSVYQLVSMYKDTIEHGKRKR